MWAIGDSAGVRGAKYAQAEGALAAAAIIADLAGRPYEPDARLARTARRHLSFQQGVNALFAAPVLTDQLADLRNCAASLLALFADVYLHVDCGRIRRLLRLRHERFEQ